MFSDELYNRVLKTSMVLRNTDLELKFGASMYNIWYKYHQINRTINSKKLLDEIMIDLKNLEDKILVTLLVQ